MSGEEQVERSGGVSILTDACHAATVPVATAPSQLKKNSPTKHAAELHDLKVELVKLRRYFIRRGDRIIVLLEGGHSADKDGSLDIGKDEQKSRLAARQHVLFEQWKSNPVDDVALDHRDAGTHVRDAMLLSAITAAAPWHIVRTDSKRHARLNPMCDILYQLPDSGRTMTIPPPESDIVFESTFECLSDHGLVR